MGCAADPPRAPDFPHEGAEFLLVGDALRCKSAGWVFVIQRLPWCFDWLIFPPSQPRPARLKCASNVGEVALYFNPALPRLDLSYPCDGNALEAELERAEAARGGTRFIEADG